MSILNLIYCLSTFKKTILILKLKMSKKITNLKILDVNKTVVFYSPLEGKEVLVRTGTIGDGSCFFHSLLHAYSKDYVGMNNHDRSKFVNRLRASMAGRVNKDNWQEIGGGLIAKIPFQEKVNNLLLNFYRFIKNDNHFRGKSSKKLINILIGKDEEKLELYDLLAELIPFNEGFEQNILPNAYSKCEEGTIDMCKTEIVNQSIKYLENVDDLQDVEPKKIEYLKETLSNFVNVLVDEAEDSAFNEYVEGLKNISDEIDSYTIGLISDRFNRDVYFIDANTRMPYQTGDTNNLKNRKSLIVMWIDQCHYEIVGRLLPGNRIQREFNSDDPLIRKINMILCNPQYIHQSYPELISYIPKEYRPKRQIQKQITNSEEESEEESEELYSD